MDEEKRTWVFTFGSGQPHAGHFVKFFGTFAEAREQMCERFGTNWAFQYTEEKYEEANSNLPDYWPRETELKE